MAYPWSANDILTAADLNAIVADLGGTGAWSTYTPTFTQSATITKTVNLAEYVQIGRLVIARVHLTATSSGTANNAVLVGLPVTSAAVSGFHPIGSAVLYDASANTFYTGAALHNSTTTARMLISGGSAYAGQTGGIFTAAVVSTDQVGFAVAYQAASAP